MQLHFFCYTGHSPVLPEIDHLMNTVSIIRSHWYIIGTRLNVPEELLQKFWSEASDIGVFSKDVYCCCKMLAYWHKEGTDVTVEKFLKVISIDPLGLDKKVPLVKNILLGEISDETISDTSPHEIDEVEKLYALMIIKVTKLINESGTDVSVFKIFLDHCKSSQTGKCKIDKKIYENASTFSELIAALESNDFITHTELSWLKCLVKDVADNAKALNEIKQYEGINITHKLHWHDSSKGTYPHGSLLMVKTNLDPALLSSSDISKMKSAVVKMTNVEETDTLLDSVSVGSVIIYWKSLSDINLQLEGTVSLSHKKQFYKLGITHIGTVYKQRATLIDIEAYNYGKLIA